MVRSCQIDSAVEAYAGKLLKARAEAEVGLLIGRLNVGSKDVVLLTCKTPDKDGEPAFTADAATASSGKKGGGRANGGRVGGSGTVATDLDADWVAEHALQVSRMLPGGLSVVGLYLWAPDGALPSTAKQLLQALESLRDLPGAATTSSSSSSSLTPTSSSSPTGGDSPPGLVLLADAATGKCSAREVPAVAKGVGDMRPADLVFLPDLAASFVAVRSSFTLDMSLMVGAGQQPPGAKLLRSAVRREVSRIASSLGVVQGADSDTAAVMTLPGVAQGGGVRVELFSPPAAVVEPAGMGAGARATAVQGRVRLTGMLAAVALVHKREPASAAVDLVKADLCASLMAREDMVVEEEEAAAADAAAAGGGKQQPLLGDGSRSRQLRLPQRVLITAKAPLLLCDLLSRGEGPEHAAEHARELLGVEVGDPSKQVEIVEPSSAVALAAAWDPTAATGASSGPRGKPRGTGLGFLAYLRLAVFVLVLACFIAAWAHNNRGWEDDAPEEQGERDPLETQETWE